MSIAAVYRPFLQLFREAGVAVDAELAELGLSFAEGTDGSTRLTPEQGRTLLAALSARYQQLGGRHELGLQAAERFLPADIDLLGYMIRHSPHPMAAVEAIAKHARLIGDTADVRVTTRGTRVTMRLGLTGGKMMIPDGADYAAASLFRFIRECSGGRTVPVEVHLPRAKPRRPQVYSRFFGMPVRFGAEAGLLVYEKAAMLVPFSHSDPRLLRILEQRAENVVASLPAGDSLQDRVRVLVRDALAAGCCDLERVAASCGLSTRTLRRRLADADTTYRQLLDDVRHEQALRLMAARHSISDIAQQLGFSDATAFARAFRRWTGLRPTEHARSLD